MGQGEFLRRVCVRAFVRACVCVLMDSILHWIEVLECESVYRTCRMFETCL